MNSATHAQRQPGHFPSPVLPVYLTCTCEKRRNEQGEERRGQEEGS